MKTVLALTAVAMGLIGSVNCNCVDPWSAMTVKAYLDINVKAEWHLLEQVFEPVLSDTSSDYFVFRGADATANYQETSPGVFSVSGYSGAVTWTTDNYGGSGQCASGTFTRTQNGDDVNADFFARIAWDQDGELAVILGIKSCQSSSVSDAERDRICDEVMNAEMLALANRVQCIMSQLYTEMHLSPPLTFHMPAGVLVQSCPKIPVNADILI